MPNCYAATAGLDLILGLGLKNIEEHIRRLTGSCMDGCSSPAANWRRHVTTVVAVQVSPFARRTITRSSAKLAESNIVTSCRDGNVRAMFHCYNNEADVDMLVRALLANRSSAADLTPTHCLHSDALVCAADMQFTSN